MGAHTLSALSAGEG